jgi:hypothetical protein
MMYSDVERAIVVKVTSAVPPLYREQKDQFARSLPMLAVLSVLFAVLLGGWLGNVLFALNSLVAAPSAAVGLVLTPFFWLALIPPILWAVSYFPLQERRLAGWRLFVAATLLALLGSLLSLSIISILFSAAILYFTVQCYDAFYR